MSKSIKKVLVSSILLLIFSFSFFVCLPSGALVVKADPADSSFGLDPVAKDAFGVDETNKLPFSTATKKNRIPLLIGQIVGIVLGFIGALFFGLVVYAGIIWMTAAGNDAKIKEAQKIMKNAIIGLALVLGAYAITRIMGDILS